MRYRIALAAGALLLAACASIPSAERYEQRTPFFYKNWQLPRGASAVVIGVKVMQPTPTSILPTPRPIVMGGWIAVDPTSGIAATPRVMAKMEFTDFFHSTAHAGEMQYIVYALPAGRYALAWLQRDGQATYMTAQFEKILVRSGITYGKSYAVLDDFGGAARVVSSAPTFDVGGNEILYAGNIVFDLRNPAVLSWAQERDDRAAAVALAGGGEDLPGKMTVRLWHRLDGGAITTSDTAPVSRPPRN